MCYIIVPEWSHGKWGWVFKCDAEVEMNERHGSVVGQAPECLELGLSESEMAIHVKTSKTNGLKSLNKATKLRMH